VFNNDKHKTYTYTYVPTMEGQYKINVCFAGRHIPKSPYAVSVEGKVADSSKVTVEGPGVNGVVPVNKMTSFRVHTTGQLIFLCLPVVGQRDFVILVRWFFLIFYEGL